MAAQVEPAGDVVSVFSESTETQTLTKIVYARIGPDSAMWQSAVTVLDAHVAGADLGRGQALLLPRRWRKFIARSRHV